MLRRHAPALLVAPGAIALSLLVSACGGEAAPAPQVPDDSAASAAPPPPGEPAPPSSEADAPRAQATASPAPGAPPADAPAASPSAPAPAPLAIPGVGTTTLEDGARITVTADDRVIIEDRPGGKASGESAFGANGFSYRKSVELMADLQQRVKAGDKEKVADLVAYPVRVNQDAGKHRIVRDRATFVRDYDQIITPKVASEVLAADARKLFCNHQGVMLGSGVIWVGEASKGGYGIKAINQ